MNGYYQFANTPGLKPEPNYHTPSIHEPLYRDTIQKEYSLSYAFISIALARSERRTCDSGGEQNIDFRKLWIALGLVMVLSFAVLGGVGYKAISNAPPIPTRVVSSDGSVLLDANAIQTGQNVWQSIGGQEVGTIWGHGAYVAPDWSADYLHRECVIILDRWAQQEGSSNYAALNVTKQFNEVESSIGPDVQQRFEELAGKLQRRAFHE